MKSHFRILIIGGGTAGVAVASRLVRKIKPEDIAIIEPSEFHYYQPLWTLVGAGVVKKESTQKKTKDVLPRGTQWIQKKVAKISPELKCVELENGTNVSYDYLVVASGLLVDFSQIKGLEGRLGKDGVCSIYDYKEAETTSKMLQNFSGGHAIFTMPPVPIKCAGAPQKIMYLADEIFRKNSVRDASKITYAAAGKTIFGVPAFAKALMEVAQKKNLNLAFEHRLVEVKADAKIAVFETASGPVEMKYDLLHVVPPMRAHDFIIDSKLICAEGTQKGWLNVNAGTLQHMVYPNIFGIGDITGVPNSKTGAAIRKQAPVMVSNLLALLEKRLPQAIYDGYSSCPLITGFGKVILAEFGYDGKLMPTFPMDMTKERRSMWHLKKDLLPQIYWRGMMKGRL